MSLEEDHRALAIKAEFMASWDALEDFYRQTQDFGWSWLSIYMLPLIRLLRSHGCNQIFYLKESPSSQLELLRGQGPFVFTRHVRMTFNVPEFRRTNMIVTFEAPDVQLRWTQKIRMTPQLDYLMQVMAAYPTHCADD